MSTNSCQSYVWMEDNIVGVQLFDNGDFLFNKNVEDNEGLCHDVL